MSVNDKLKKLLNEEGTEGLKGAGQALFGKGGYARKLLALPFDIGKKITVAMSKTGKFIQATLNKMDEKTFKKELGIKDLKELDIALSKLHVDDPEFIQLLGIIFEKINKSKFNKDLQKELNAIYEKHLDRVMRDTMGQLKTEKDEKKSTEIYGRLLGMLNAIWDKKSPLIDKILEASVNYLDRDLDRGKDEDDEPRHAYVPIKGIDATIKIPAHKMTDTERKNAIAYYRNQIDEIRKKQVGILTSAQTIELGNKLIDIKTKLDELIPTEKPGVKPAEKPGVKPAEKPAGTKEGRSEQERKRIEAWWNDVVRKSPAKKTTGDMSSGEMSSTIEYLNKVKTNLENASTKEPFLRAETAGKIARLEGRIKELDTKKRRLR